MTNEVTDLGSVDNLRDIQAAVQNTRVSPLISSEMEMLKRKQREGNAEEKRVLDFLFEYEQVMGTDKDHGEEGNRMQIRLLRIYMDIIDVMSASDFRSCWSIVLLFAKLHRVSSFSPMNINRYSYLWTGKDSALTCFHMVNNIILLTCDPETRARNVRRQLDFSKSLEKFVTAEGLQKVVGYYKT